MRGQYRECRSFLLLIVDIHKVPQTPEKVQKSELFCTIEVSHLECGQVNIISDKRAEKVLGIYSDYIKEISGRYGISPAAIEAVAIREMSQINVADIFADLLVRLNHFIYRLGGKKQKDPGKKKSILVKRDSSTGYCQIFARVALNALNYGCLRGMTTYRDAGVDRPEGSLEPSSFDDVFYIWKKLHRDRNFNFHMALLNLISAGEETVGHTRFGEYGEDDMKRMFSRYNANTRNITSYGEETYRIYEKLRGDRQ